MGSNGEVFVFSKASASPQYTDRRSGAAKDASFFFHPQLEQQAYNKYTLSQRFGQRPVAGYPDVSFVYPVFFVDASAAVPIGGGHNFWRRVWSDEGSWRKNDYTCWEVKPESIPAGYVCLSPCFFKKVENGDGHHLKQPPSDDDVRGMVAVRQDLVTYVSGNALRKVWDDKGTYAAQDLSIYTGPDCLGCFAFPYYYRPNGTFPVLDPSKGFLL